MTTLVKVFAFPIIFAIIHSSLAFNMKNQIQSKRDIGSDLGDLAIAIGASVVDLIRDSGIQNEFHAKVGERK